MENKGTILEKASFYDKYDYSKFWDNRNYEHAAETIAIKNFLKHSKLYDQIIDVGGGLGRLVPVYALLYKKANVIEPSGEQVARATKELSQKYPTVTFTQGVAEALPFANAVADVIICVRVSHHLPNMEKPIAEFSRVVKKDGLLILEVANKLNFKSRLRAVRNCSTNDLYSDNPISVGSRKGSEVPFVNHNPKAIRAELEKQGFEIIKVRSVSNFRSGFFKKVFPMTFLLFFERILQKPLASFWFGPSIFFLARKK